MFEILFSIIGALYIFTSVFANVLSDYKNEK